MDYKKAIEVLANEIGCVDLDANNRGYIDESEKRFIDACNTAISTIEELQAIHNNGISLERLKDIDFRKQVVEHINYMDYMDVKDELEEYKQLGTLEEVREAVEKQRKVKPEDGEYCPICHTFLKDEDDVPGFYCMNCGQHIDWSEEDD